MTEPDPPTQSQRAADAAARIIGGDERQPKTELPPPRYDYPNPMGGFANLFWYPFRPTPEDRKFPLFNAVIVLAIVVALVAVVWAFVAG